MLPSSPIWRKRTPSSYSEIATRPPSWNVGCSWNQCTEHPNAPATGLPSAYTPLPAGGTWASGPSNAVDWPARTFDASYVENSLLLASQRPVKFCSPPIRTNLSAPSRGHRALCTNLAASPVWSTFGCSGDPPSAALTEIAANGWQEH